MDLLLGKGMAQQRSVAATRAETTAGTDRDDRREVEAIAAVIAVAAAVAAAAVMAAAVAEEGDGGEKGQTTALAQERKEEIALRATRVGTSAAAPPNVERRRGAYDRRGRTEPSRLP